MKKNAKIFITTFILSFFMLNNTSVFANEEKIIKLQVGNKVANVNGKNVTMNVEPYIQEKTNSTMIPLRFEAIVLGIDEDNIIYDTSKKTIKITKDNNVVEFFVGYSGYKINGSEPKKYGKNDPVVEIKNGRTFTPLRLIKDAFNLQIEWDSKTKTVTLKDSKQIKEEKDEEIQKEEEVIRLVNEERAKVNLPPLQIDKDLMKLSKLKAEDMLKNNYFDHTSPTYGEIGKMMEDFNVDFFVAGENIALGYPTSKEVVEGWMNSPTHKANILNKDFKYIGVGISGTLWSQMFKG